MQKAVTSVRRSWELRFKKTQNYTTHPYGIFNQELGLFLYKTSKQDLDQKDKQCLGSLELYK